LEFHSADLILGINFDYELNGLCLWNNNYLLCGDYNRMINIIELKEGKCIKKLIGHSWFVYGIEKFYHPVYGECLISNDKEHLLLWSK